MGQEDSRLDHAITAVQPKVHIMKMVKRFETVQLDEVKALTKTGIRDDGGRNKGLAGKGPYRALSRAEYSVDFAQGKNPIIVNGRAAAGAPA
jgi:hypothetical protein